MREQDTGFDIDRYRRLLAAADNESKRLALIDLMIQERAMDRLQAHRAAVATVSPTDRTQGWL